MKQVVTISGIRPDFIRMSHVFKALDNDPNIEHIMIHTGQHYDDLLSLIFFKELHIRKPDYNFLAGSTMDGPAGITFHILKSIHDLIQSHRIKPDLFLFLGDSNSVCCAMELKKEGYQIGHIEAGMRSYDNTMLEETNRIVCDHCSDILFVYHSNYAEKLKHEGITKNVHIVGNTIIEPTLEIIKQKGIIKPIFPYTPQSKHLVAPVYVDIHRPENFKSKARMIQILKFCNYIKEKYVLPEIRWIMFPRTMAYLKEYGFLLKHWKIIPVPMMGYIDFLQAQATSKFLISDSGTAQEEAALVNCPVIVPRDFTERPESVDAGCSHLLKLVIPIENDILMPFNPNIEKAIWDKACDFIENATPLFGSRWLYYSQYETPSQLILKHIKEFLHV